VALADLRSFLTHPVRGFLRQRLDVSVPQEHEEVDDALPVEVESLDLWAVGDRVLQSLLAGADIPGVLLAEQLRGDLPPLKLGEKQLTSICERVQELADASHDARQTEARSYDVTVDLGGGRRLTGVVPDVLGNRITRVHYSSLGPKHRLEAWTDLLALSAGFPDQSWRSDVYGWHSRTKRAQHSLVPPLDHRCLDLLRDLVDLYDRGLREPLPMPLKTGSAYAEAVHGHRDGGRAAYNAWTSSDSSPVPGEQDDAAHVRVYGRGAPIRCLEQPARDNERWGSEGHRLGQLALRLWQPLLDREQVFQV
jgi:exodeoxyribonuclease V gamma subunit